MKTYREAEEIKLVFSGADYFDVLEQIIDGSQETLHLQTYIFECDETGLRIAEALKRAALRNVKVFVLIDAYGSFPFSKVTSQDFTDAGIHFRLYSPLFSSESKFFGRRLHHKIIVADKKTALTGGINIANKYSGKDGQKPWLDYAVLTRGHVCEYLHWVCDMFFYRRNSKKINNFESQLTKPKNNPQGLIRFRRNDWIKNKNEIYKSYAEAIIGAQDSITIVASYFLPGHTFQKLLASAASRGVQINIILAGVSDIPSLRQAEHFMVNFYLSHHINIYEWTNSVMHGKAMIIDQNWVTIGSYNLNLLSHYISVELNTDILDPGFIGTFSKHLEEIIRHQCTRIELSKKENKISSLQKLRMWIFYQVYRALMNFMMFGRKYKKRKY